MSVLDDLSNLEARVRDRMRELRPLLEEYRELEQVAQRLGVNADGDAPPDAATEQVDDGGGGAAAQPKRRRTRAGRTDATGGEPRKDQRAGRPSRQRRANGAGNGNRREQVLAAVRQQPGVTVRGVADQLGVDPTSLYKLVNRLESDGELVKQGRELQPANP